MDVTKQTVNLLYEVATVQKIILKIPNRLKLLV